MKSGKRKNLASIFSEYITFLVTEVCLTYNNNQSNSTSYICSCLFIPAHIIAGTIRIASKDVAIESIAKLV